MLERSQRGLDEYPAYVSTIREKPKKGYAPFKRLVINPLVVDMTGTKEVIGKAELSAEVYFSRPQTARGKKCNTSLVGRMFLSQPPVSNVSLIESEGKETTLKVEGGTTVDDVLAALSKVNFCQVLCLEEDKSFVDEKARVAVEGM